MSMSKQTDIPTWAGRKLALIEAYQAATKVAMATDECLSLLLIVKYGKRAGDMRYRAPETTEIADAMQTKLHADAAQQAAWKAYQEMPLQEYATGGIVMFDAPTCHYCDGNMDDLSYSPYCGAQCAIDSERDK